MRVPKYLLIPLLFTAVSCSKACDAESPTLHVAAGVGDQRMAYSDFQPAILSLAKIADKRQKADEGQMGNRKTRGDVRIETEAGCGDGGHNGDNSTPAPARHWHCGSGKRRQFYGAGGGGEAGGGHLISTWVSGSGSPGLTGNRSS